MTLSLSSPSGFPADPFAGVNWGPTIGVAFMGLRVVSSVRISSGITCGCPYNPHILPLSRPELYLPFGSPDHNLVWFSQTFVGCDFCNIFGKLYRSIPSEIIVNAVIAFLVESFFTIRIWKLSSNIPLAIFCECWVSTHFGLSPSMYHYQLLRVVSLPCSAEFGDFQVGVVALKSTGTTGLAVAVVTDVILAGCLSFYLYKSRTGFQRSDDMITKLIALTITTGLLTTLSLCLRFAKYVVAPEDFYLLFFNFMLGKLYINSLLTSLNSRAAIIKAGRINHSSHHMTNSYRFEQFRNYSSNLGGDNGGESLTINVKQSTERDSAC
ncbi:hypothetical protein BU17DRAFT_61922 [Hysterangium stoloniferum]|nr:hypothetical protein BU17DRAFT_61922 [Hysterangium stoloniferum]